MSYIEKYIKIFMLLYAINFGGLYPVLSLLIVVVLYVFLVENDSEFHIYSMTICVILFGVLYLVFDILINNENIAEKVYQYVSMFILGSILGTYTCKNNNYKDLMYIILWAVVGFGLYGVITTFRTGGVFSDSHRRLADIWDASQVVAATQVTAWLTLYSAIIPWFLLNIEKTHIYERIIIGGLSILSAISFFVLSSRTGIIIVICEIVFSIVLLVKHKKRNVYGWIFFIIFVGIVAFILNIGGIQDDFWNSNLMQRILTKSSNGSAFETSRTYNWQYVLTNWTKHLWGGYHFSKSLGVQIHNIVLDLFDQVGIVVTSLFVVIVIKHIKALKKWVYLDPSDLNFGKGLLCLFFINGIVLFTEPVWFYGKSNYVAFCFFIFGLVEHSSKYLEENLDDEIRYL